MHDDEIWKPCLGHEGYSVSDKGRVRSETRIVVRRNGRPHTVKGGILKPFPDSKDRLQVKMRKGPDKPDQVFVHKLVWEAFNGPVPNGHDIDHIDQDHRNNELYNLQTLTRKEHGQKTFEAIKRASYEEGYQQALLDFGLMPDSDKDPIKEAAKDGFSAGWNAHKMLTGGEDDTQRES